MKLIVLSLNLFIVISFANAAATTWNNEVLQEFPDESTNVNAANKIHLPNIGSIDQYVLKDLISIYIDFCPYYIYQDERETSEHDPTFRYFDAENATLICNSFKYKMNITLSNIKQTEQEFIMICNSLLEKAINIKELPIVSQRLAVLSAERGLWKALQHLLKSGAQLTQDIVEMPSWKEFMGIENTEHMYGNILMSKVFRSYSDKLKHILQYACVEGNQKLITYLIDSGLSLNSTNLGIGFIWNALTRHNFQLVDFLVYKGANISGKNDQGLTLLHLSALLDQDTDILQYLLDNGLDINILSNTGLTPLDMSHGHSYRFLTSKGALMANELKLVRKNSVDSIISLQSENTFSHPQIILQV